MTLECFIYDEKDYIVSNKPTVSVIIATHNNVDTIENCIDSIWFMEFSDIEVVVVDVNSTDGTKDLLAQVAKNDEQVIFLVDSWGSIGHAKNVGLTMQGENMLSLQIRPASFTETHWKASICGGCF